MPDEVGARDRPRRRLALRLVGAGVAAGRQGRQEQDRDETRRDRRTVVGYAAANPDLRRFSSRAVMIRSISPYSTACSALKKRSRSMSSWTCSGL